MCSLSNLSFLMQQGSETCGSKVVQPSLYNVYSPAEIKELSELFKTKEDEAPQQTEIAPAALHKYFFFFSLLQTLR